VQIWREYVVWWCGLWVGYLGLVTSPTGWEIPLGAAIAAAAAAVGVLGRRAFRPPGRFPAVAGRGARIPLEVVRDTWVLVRLLVSGRVFREEVGEFETVRLAEQDASGRAWSVLLASAAPASVAVDIEGSDHPRLRVHRLSAPRSSGRPRGSR